MAGSAATFKVSISDRTLPIRARINHVDLKADARIAAHHVQLHSSSLFA
jgi:hypothetical protein